MPVQHVTPGALSKTFQALHAAKLARARHAVLVSCRTDGMRVLMEEVERAKPYPPVDRGMYRRAWRALQTPQGAMLSNSLPYASIIELGRRAGRPMPPVALIVEWVRRKKLIAKAPPGKGSAKKRRERATRGLGYVIARSIARKGIQGRFVMRHAWARLRPIVRQAVKQALQGAKP